ncbi:MAG: hypothetical protein ACKOGA_11285, partial [Planctomycetaceae bacterium]
MPNEAGEGSDPTPLRLARRRLYAASDQLVPLLDALQTAEPAVIGQVREELARREPRLTGERTDAVERLWEVALDWGSETEPPADSPDRAAPGLRSAAALSALDPGDPRWRTIAGRVITQLASLDSTEGLGWRELVGPVKEQLLPDVLAAFELSPPESRMRERTREMLADWARHNPDSLVAGLLESDPASFQRLIPVARANRARVVERLWEEVRSSLASFAAWPPPLDPERRREIPESVAQEFIEAKGAVHPEFAYCLELPRARFASICHELAQGGYRPVQMLIHSRSGALVVTAIWHRDGLPWLLREDISPAEALEEDRRQRVAGLESVGIDFRGRERVTVLWSAGVVWGRPRRRPFGSNPELRLVNDQRFTGRWRSRYYQLPQWPVDGRPDTALLERSTPVLELTANSLLEGHSRLWAQLRPGEAGRDPVFSEPRHVVLVADTEFHSPAGEFLLQGTAVHGLRVELDGVALDLGEFGGDGFHPALAQTVTLTEGHHTLRAVFHWRQLDRRTSLGLGAPRIEWPVVDSRPDWLFDTDGSSDLEQAASIRRAEFDAEQLTLTADLHGTQ